MKAALISIGDELLIGQTVNTNVTWLGKELADRGFEIITGYTVRDDEQAITEAIDQAIEKADVILISGGLGPTRDDITKEVLTNYFKMELRLNEAVLDHVRRFFAERGRSMPESNVYQAMLPSGALVLHNELGTAPGMCFEYEQKLIFSLPGVPYELKNIMEKEGFPLLASRYPMQKMFYKTIQIQGIGESLLAERITALEDHIRQQGLSLAYLPQPGLIRLRISGQDNESNREGAKQFTNTIIELMPHLAIDTEKDLSEYVGESLRELNQTLCTAESCTGGKIAAEIVRIPGSSHYFEGSIVAYANEIKEALLAVPVDVINAHGAVSKEVVERMAANGRLTLRTDYCLAASGVAGPSGGTEQNPVGTVWIAVASANGVLSRKFRFGNDRERNISMTVLSALNMLRCAISGIAMEKS